MMIFLISSVVGKEKEDSSEVQQLLLSTSLSSFSLLEMKDNSRQIFLIFYISTFQCLCGFVAIIHHHGVNYRSCNERSA